MSTANNLAKVGAAGLSTLRRGFVGALLCYVSGGLISWVAYVIVRFLNGDSAHWIREIWAGLLGGAVGGYMGVWVLEHTLKRYPGRTIAWIYCSLWGLGAVILAIRAIIVLLRIWPEYGVKDVADPMEFHQSVAGLAESAIFYYCLIKPRQNLMMEHQSVLKS
jgi:hypothetical protein